jgi:hypothetical protein
MKSNFTHQNPGSPALHNANITFYHNPIAIATYRGTERVSFRAFCPDLSHPILK